MSSIPATRSPFALVVALVPLLASTGTAQALARAGDDGPGSIPWRSGAAARATAGSADPARAALRLAALALEPRRHVVVQFTQPVTDELRASLAAAGVSLLRYLGENAFFAALEPELVDAAVLSGVPTVLQADSIRPEHKLHAAWTGGRAPEHAVVALDARGGAVVAAYVVFHADVPLAAAEAVVARHGTVRDSVSLVNALVVELPRAGLTALAEEDAVQWVEPPLPRMSEWNDSNRPRIGADTAQAAPYSLSGAGVTVLVYDGGFARATHQDFGGRLTVRDASGLSGHATHVSGTIGGSGAASGGLRRGMAPGVTLQSYGFQYDGTGIFLYTNPGDMQADYDQAINSFGADIANNSIGTNTETNGFPCDIQGDYGVTDQLIDSIVRGGLGTPFRVVWANGNERQGSRCDVEGFGDYYSTAPPATAKNHITVGALNSNNDTMTSFSSWGPTDDGRMKPDVSGPGCQSDGDFGVTSCYSGSDTQYASLCGTSMASPSVCGAAALLMEDYRVRFPGPDLRNSTLKILLAQTAVDLGNAGPDYQFGYGSVRIVPAIDFMRLGKLPRVERVPGRRGELRRQRARRDAAARGDAGLGRLPRHAERRALAGQRPRPARLLALEQPGIPVDAEPGEPELARRAHDAQLARQPRAGPGRQPRRRHVDGGGFRVQRTPGPAVLLDLRLAQPGRRRPLHAARRAARRGGQRRDLVLGGDGLLERLGRRLFLRDLAQHGGRQRDRDADRRPTPPAPTTTRPPRAARPTSTG